jgi:signal transduction histidine kinase
VAVTAIVLLLIGVGAASVVRIGLRPLTRMAGMATEIAGTDDLSRRAEDVNPHTETGRLGIAVNAMLVRIQAALHARTASEQRLRQFLADASHELRTPLTSIMGFAELYRRGGIPAGPELDEAMARIDGEVGRMRVLVNDLLLLARLDEERPLADAPVDLLGVAAETVRDVVDLTSLPTGIRIGQSTTVVVTIQTKANVLAVPNAAVTTVGGFSVVTLAGQSQPTRVQIGLVGDSFTEITSGLTAGQQVVLPAVNTSGTTTNPFGGGFGGFGGGGFGGGGFGGGTGGGGAGRGTGTGGNG